MNPNTIGNQLMRLEPAKRRCPQCLGPITLRRGCSNRGLPTCEKCGIFPRGTAGETDMSLTLDSTGTVAGWAREPENAKVSGAGRRPLD
ncbi:MAG TPA: hypothetical protein PLN31_20835 [Azoarcus taiwanensis]|nr:hypothetical protein [Azoarcus taiwanensis]